MTVRNPYPGAKPLTADDPTLLLGRDPLLIEFARHMRSYPVVMIAGPSGVGKSSLIGAGFGGRLERESKLVVRSFSAWSQLPAVNGVSFYAHALRVALGSGSGPAQREVDAFLRDVPAFDDDDEAAEDFIVDVQSRFGLGLVVVFDQLEELLRDEPHLGRNLLENVRHIAEEFPDGYTQVVSLREEYVAHLKIIEEPLDKGLWHYKLLREVGAEVISDLVTVPLAGDGRGVVADRDLVEAIAATWMLARPDTAAGAAREVVDERRPGLLHLQAFLFAMYEELAPEAGTVLTRDAVTTGMDLTWPDTEKTAVAFFAQVFERYLDLVLDQREAEFLASGGDPRERRQQADETRRVIAALPEHLSSAGYKLVRGTDGLAATVLTQLRELHRPIGEGGPGTATTAGERGLPADMGNGNDIGPQVTAIAIALAKLCRTLHLQNDAGALRQAAVEHYPGLEAWGDQESTAGRLYGSSALHTACELVVTYERALRWLDDSNVIRMTPTQEGERRAAIVHDGFGAALVKWASKALDVPRVEIALPVAITGKQVFHRSGSDEDEALDEAQLPNTEGLSWIGCNVSAFFHGLVFRNCDLRSTLFIGCRFRNVVFEDCVTHGLLFIACTFEGGFTIRSTVGSAGGDRQPGLRPDSELLRTVTLRACTVVDGPLRFEGLGGYGVFLDELDGAWEVAHSSFSHLRVTGPAAGPGRVVSSPELRHVVVIDGHPHPIVISGDPAVGALDAPAYLEAPAIDVVYERP